jgi:16S rRNA (guanine966-N2)-methyltransferase
VVLYLLGGKWKGRSISSPRQKETRPTTARVRQAIFDICQFWIEGAEVLELFAGTGAVSLEALSRGARHVTLIESHPLAIKMIRENFLKLGVSPDAYSLRRGTVLLELKKLSPASFELIYMDPPYSQTHLEEILFEIESKNLLKKEGFLFLECARESKIQTSFKSLKIKKSYFYGKTALHLFTLEGKTSS